MVKLITRLTSKGRKEVEKDLIERGHIHTAAKPRPATTHLKAE